MVVAVLLVLVVGLVVGLLGVVVGKPLYRYFTQRNAYKHLPKHSEAVMPLLEALAPTGKGTENFLFKMRKDDGTSEPLLDLGVYYDGSAYVGVSDVDLLKEIFNKTDVFRKQPVAYDPLDFILGQGLVISYGEVWRRERKLLTPLFHFQSLKEMIPIMASCCQQFINHIKEGKHNCEERSIYAPVEMGDLALKVVINCIFGGEFDAEQMGRLWHQVVIDLRYHFIGKTLLPDIWDWLPVPWSIRPKQSAAKIKKLVQEAIEKKKALLQQQESSGTPVNKDLLSAMLSVVDEETGKTIDSKLIVDEALTFLLAGHDTTSVLLSWCFYFISIHKEIQEALQEEADEILKDQLPSEQNIKKLIYTRQVLQETLRLRPPLPGFLDRLVTQDFYYKGMLFPKGTTVGPYFLPNHLSPLYWNDPLTFNPSRFNESTTEGSKIHPFVYLPFSAGPRNCLGSKFALQEATVILSMIMQNFNVHRNPDAPINMCFVGTVTPVGLRVWFTPRESSSQ